MKLERNFNLVWLESREFTNKDVRIKKMTDWDILLKSLLIFYSQIYKVKSEFSLKHFEDYVKANSMK